MWGFCSINIHIHTTQEGERRIKMIIIGPNVYWVSIKMICLCSMLDLVHSWVGRAFLSFYRYFGEVPAVNKNIWMTKVRRQPDCRGKCRRNKATLILSDPIIYWYSQNQTVVGITHITAPAPLVSSQPQAKLYPSLPTRRHSYSNSPDSAIVSTRPSFSSTLPCPNSRWCIDKLCSSLLCLSWSRSCYGVRPVHPPPPPTTTFLSCFSAPCGQIWIWTHVFYAACGQIWAKLQSLSSLILSCFYILSLNLTNIIYTVIL